MKKLFAFDLVVLGYAAIVTALILAMRPPGWPIYLAYHAAALVLVALVIYAEARYGGPLWTFLRYWYVIVLILAAYRELHYLVPQVHPFDDHHFDRTLAALDRRLFGDVDGFFLSLARFSPGLIDVLHLCYWSYFAVTFIPGIVLYTRREVLRLREYSAVILSGLYLSYLGYILGPAIGPHHFLSPRPPELNGWRLGGPLHATLIEIEWKMPDAFPSGHALVMMLVLVMTWKHARRTFWCILPPAVGCIFATMALRYHYIVDVLASLLLVPVALLIGTRLHRLRDRTG